MLGGVVEAGVSGTGIAGGVAIGAGVSGAGAFGRAIVGLGELGLGAAFLATGLALAFFGAALTALPAFLALALIGRAFFFAALFLTARLAFATGRFLDLLFFAMVTSSPRDSFELAVRVAPKKSAVICV